MNMKFLLTSVAAVMFAAAGSAHAADIVTYQEAPVAAPEAAPAFSWTGLYLGGTIGGSWAQSKNRIQVGGVHTKGKKVNPEGFIGGVYGGYNYQLKNNIVVGAETDFLWGDVDDSGRNFGKRAKDDWNKMTDDGKSNYRRVGVKQKWNGATRLRVGYPVGERFLPYIAGGVSYADIETSGTRYISKADEILKDGKKTKTKARAGWNVGAGVDYVPPILGDHLVLRAEYRYTDFGNETYKLNAGGSDLAKYRVKYNQNDFRVGVAYKF